MKKGVLIFLLMVAMILIVTQGAFARTGCQTSVGTYVETLADPTAPGTKVTGVIAIAYVDIGKTCSDLGEARYPNTYPWNVWLAKKMVFSARLYKNNALFPFSGSADVCYLKFEDHMPYIRDFVTNKVIPIVFKDTPTVGWKLKSVDNLIEDDNRNVDFAGCCSEYFSIMDITIAVQ